MNKKFMAMLLVIVMVVSMVPMAASAIEITFGCNHNAEDWENNTLNNNGNCTVCGTHFCVFGTSVSGKDSTCTEKGYTAHKKCSYDCGKTEGFVELDLAQHDVDNDGNCTVCGTHVCVFGIDVSGKDATCTEKGVVAHKKCSYNCGKTEGYAEIDVIAHDVDNDGICSMCGEHICFFGIDVAGKDATCTEKGVAAHKKCSYNCGKTQGYAEIDVIEHDLDNDGICSMCGEHICVFGIDVAGKDATCTEKGVKAHKKCSYNCGATQGYEEIDVIEHDLDNDGNCTMCGEHFCVFGIDVAGKEPTCTEDGVKPHKKCSYNCGATQGYEVIPALKHSMVLVDSKNPTYLAAGYKVYACANGCGETHTEVLAKLVPASTDGYDYVPRTGSAFVEWLYALIFG